jgi:hypothetical protein
MSYGTSKMTQKQYELKCTLLSLCTAQNSSFPMTRLDKEWVVGLFAPVSW